MTSDEMDFNYSALTYEKRQDIIRQYRKGTPIFIIAQRLKLNQYQVCGVIIDYKLESADVKERMMKNGREVQ